MYALKNKVQLIGNVGAAPEVKSFEANKKVARLSLATNETYKNNKGEKIVETQWHNLVGWGRIADLIAQYVKKGTEIAIEGKLVNKSYTSKNGEKRYSTEIQINEILLLNDKSGKN